MAATDDNDTDGGAQTDVPKTKRVFPHSASVGDITLDDEMGGEYDLEGADEVAVLGYEVISTTGDFYVEREFLLGAMERVGLPEWMAPDRTAPYRAWSRARDELLEGGYRRDDSDETSVSIRYRLEDDSSASRVENLIATIHIPGDHVGTEGGKNNDIELGVIAYDSDTKKPRFRDKLDTGSEGIRERLSQSWEMFQLRFAELFDKHLDGHVGKDINTMFNQYFINNWTDSVQLRPAVYFVPATQELPNYWGGESGEAKSMRDLIGYDEGEGHRRGFAGLYAYLNDIKERGKKTEDTEIIRLPVYDNADQRKMVQRKVRKELEDAVRTAYSKIIEQMQSDDVVAEEVAKAVSDRFSDMGGTAQNYKAIIQTEMAVEDVMEDVLNDMDDVDSQTVRDVVAELDSVDTDL